MDTWYQMAAFALVVLLVTVPVVAMFLFVVLTMLGGSSMYDEGPSDD